ncbi:uromodulin-like isoform X4 [Ctenopharyngodon idella]|uniref:uromodulin-like isoform X4 n=1 Tax=Ctenopharyngodon idella TaxID=7959 RepID=UPI00222F9129|nr:uromodulin-like isoform X4 [Ctenopharyngodon idella]
MTSGDCCPDYYQTCNQSNSQPSLPSSPSPPTSTSPDSPILGPSSSSSSASKSSAPTTSSSPSPTPPTSSSSGQCSVPTALCCPGSLGCNRGGCYCDEICMTAGDCCPDYYQTCNQSNSQPSIPSSPSPPTSTSPDSPILGPSSSSSSASKSSAPTTSSSPSPTPPTSSSSVCDNCTENEACQERGGVYGCGCLQGQRPNPEIFDAVESCASSTGSISLSRCQLFESGFYPETLHLNDPSCKGTLENGRLLFYFDNEGHICGTTLTSNSTHFIYQNSIQSNPRNTEQSIISRDIWMNMTFSCAYPLIQTLSMPMGFRAEGGVISNELPAGQGTYQIRMMPYHDAQFTSPYLEEQVQVNQQMYVAVEVEGVDRNQIATVLDNCWATPVNDPEYHVRWNLISRECPNPEDTTVEVLQNGIDTTSHFSFRMFTFSGISDHVFLHCEVHLCLVQNGRCALSCNHGYRSRRHRSLDFLHSAAISMGLKAQ